MVVSVSSTPGLASSEKCMGVHSAIFLGFEVHRNLGLPSIHDLKWSALG